jgi:hypothetical protein
MESWKTALGSQGACLKQTKRQPNKESTYSFSWDVEKGDVDDDADHDDEVRTSMSQNYATATLSTEELYLRTQYL